MTVWHFFVIVSLNGSIYFDDWAYAERAECEEKHSRIEEILTTENSEVGGFHLSSCEKITLSTKG